MKIIASLVLYKHQYADIEPTINSLINEETISKIVIVDNGGECHWLKDYSHPKIEILILKTNCGFGTGHNEVFRRYAEQYEFTLICNPDIAFKSGEVDKLYHYCVINKIGLSIPKVIYPDGSLQHCCRLLPTPYQLFIRRFFTRLSSGINETYELHQADLNQAFFAPSLSGCFMLMSRDALKETKGFDPRFFLYLEDVDLSRRVSQSEFAVRYCPDSVVVHEAQRSSYQNKKFMIYHVVSAIKYFNKWGWFCDKERAQLNQKCLSQLPTKNGR